jgi:hypothetical protein
LPTTLSHPLSIVNIANANIQMLLPHIAWSPGVTKN